jgi:glycosyltransferase involved in cell wall biosynthesis
MRILLVEPDFEDNGAIRVSLDRARRWVEAGAYVTVLFVSGQSLGKAIKVPASLDVVVASKALRSARWMLPSAILRGLHLAYRSDVVVGGREIASGLLIGSLLARLTRRPFAVTIHSDVEAALDRHGTPRHRRNVLACIREASLAVPVSDGLVQGLVELGVAESRIKVVPNGIDAAQLRLLAGYPPTLTLPTGPFMVGLGRLSHEKAFDLLIRAHAEALRGGSIPHRLLLMGEGPDHADLVQLAATLGVSDTVLFAGFVDNPYPVLARADLFVLPSRWEGFSLALAEALSLGVPAIATDCVAGPRQILEGGRHGKLVPVDDVPALAAAITHHFNHPEELRGQSLAARETIGDRFDARSAALAHLEVLEAISRRAAG